MIPQHIQKRKYLDSQFLNFQFMIYYTGITFCILGSKILTSVLDKTISQENILHQAFKSHIDIG